MRKNDDNISVITPRHHRPQPLCEINKLQLGSLIRCSPESDRARTRTAANVAQKILLTFDCQRLTVNRHLHSTGVTE
jgi:hypothetical protein